MKIHRLVWGKACCEYNGLRSKDKDMKVFGMEERWD